MTSKASRAVKLNFVHVPKDAVGYELLCLNNIIHIDQEGKITPATITVYPFKREGDKRTPLPVNGDPGAQHYLFIRYDEQKQMGNTLYSSWADTYSSMRFELVPMSVKGAYTDTDVLAAVPVAVTRDGTDGSGAAFTSIVFKRATSKPTKPTGGTYSDPVPSGWTDAPSSGSEPLWVSRARFTPEMNGATSAPKPTWSDPAPVEDSTGIEYVFSHVETDPGTPVNQHPHDHLGLDGWNKIPEGAIWMAVAVKNNGIWEDWSCFRVKGETGQKGDAGRTVEIPPPRLWSSYPDNYEFQNGVVDCNGNPATRHDMVVVPGNGASGPQMYSCRVSHKKSPDHDPEKDNTSISGKATSAYWQHSSSFRNIATEVLLADKAYIGIMSSNGIQLWNSTNSGADPTLCGEIRGYADANSMMAWIGGSFVNPLWGVLGNGRQYYGGIHGQHIEIDPDDKTMRVYDANGACVATHSGRRISLSDAVPSGSTAEATKSATGNFTKVSTQGAGSQTKTISNTTGVGASGMLRIQIPAYIMTVRTNGYNQVASGQEDDQQIPTTSASLSLIVRVNGVQKQTRLIGSASVGDLADGSNGSPGSQSATVIIPACVETVQLAKGDKYSVEVVLKTDIDGGSQTGGEVNCLASGTVTNITAGFVAKVYRCEYGANGWVISYDTENYVYMLMGDDNQLHVKAVGGGVKIFGND